MVTKITLERWCGYDRDWKATSVLILDVPFANVKINFVLEMVALAGSVLAKQEVPAGRYRLGQDDETIFEWVDGRPRLLRRLQTASPSAMATRQAFYESN